MKALWDELSSLSAMLPCTCGHGKAQAQDRAMEFLQGLHSRYSPLRSQILLMEPFPSVTKIYSLVRQEEKQQEIHSSAPSITMPEAAALTVNSVATYGIENRFEPSQHRANVSTNNRGQHPNKSFNRHNTNSNQRNIGGDHRQTGKPRMHCDYCDRDNHNRDTCYRLHGYPTDRSKSSSNNHRLLTSSSSGTPRSNDRALVAAPLITQDQYNNILAMLSSGSNNLNANLAAVIHFTRERRKPSYLQDYHCSAVANATLPSPTDSNRTDLGICSGRDFFFSSKDYLKHQKLFGFVPMLGLLGSFAVGASFVWLCFVEDFLASFAFDSSS
ncbi:hypothetical protein Vadar_015875 [Vaccinium darrowii]|uniref:Uncharacterized protein n=1 Tax=Vaccinium darrowii TaxID=229202 RepID=A0ACB7XHZ6_9ERIC|nr:hypothetical protein Vadar_015875 [Vaccinium darrowii]